MTLLLTINVTDVNETPDISNLPANVSIPEDVIGGLLSVYNVSASDVDGDGLSYTLISTPAGAPFTVSATGEIETTATPGLDHETDAVYTLSIQVSDGSLSVTSDLTVYITDVNEVPVFNNDTVEEVVLETETSARVVYIMAATDQDVGDTLVYSINTTTPAPAPFTCDPSTGELNLYGMLFSWKQNEYRMISIL